jgi:hypothetical protein
LRDDSTETFSVGEVKEHEHKSTDQVLMKVTIRLDDKTSNVRRSEYNWNMWFIAIGGFERSMKKLFSIFVGGITATSY